MAAHKHERIAEVLSAASPETVLDIGYAQLPNAHVVKEGRKVYGVDIVEKPAPGYEKTFVVDLNTQTLPFPDASIDAVVMGCTLAHVANPLRALMEVNRVLIDGGMLIVSSPNPNYYWENVLNIFYHHFKGRVVKAKHYEHFFEFSRYNMRTSANRCGFRVVNEIGCTFKLVKLGWSFDPKNVPGLSYEIVYVMEKTGAPEEYATFEDTEGIHEIPTSLGR